MQLVRKQLFILPSVKATGKNIASEGEPVMVVITSNDTISNTSSPLSPCTGQRGDDYRNPRAV